MNRDARATLTLGMIAMLAAAQDAAEKDEALTVDPLPLKRAMAREFNRQFVAARTVGTFDCTSTSYGDSLIRSSKDPCGAQTTEQAERAKRLADEKRMRRKLAKGLT